MKKKSTILLADDEPIFLDFIAYELDAAGFRVLRAESTSEALQLCAKESVDLIICDIRLPGTNGFNLVKKIREMLKAKIPVLFMTAFAAHQEAEMSDLGAVGVLSKPFEAYVLIESVRRILINIEEEEVEEEERL